MEYSNYLPPHRFLMDFWNMEYSKKILQHKKLKILNMNIPKNSTTAKISKFWIMEYSMKESWNIPKKCITNRGGVKFNLVI